MNVKGAIAFILIIFLLVVIFVGLPYFLEKLKSADFNFFNFTNIFSKKSAPSGNYYISGNQPVIRTPLEPTIKPGESIYKGKVRISSVYRSNPEVISLNAAYFSAKGGSASGGESSIDITGWKIRSAQRGETLIGRGINIPQFDIVPFDIWLIGGESVQIIAGASPLANNFRVNSCFGGLSGLYNLNFGNYCPALKVDNISSFDSSCQDLMLRSSSCLAPSDDILNRQSAQCRAWFEKNVNYNACVARHQNDKDFYRGWRIYTGNANQIFDQLHDRIELRDQAGLLVDNYEY